MLLARRLSVVALVIMVMVSFGCATTSMKHFHAQQLATFNDFMDSYRFHYERASPERQAEWDEKITPILKELSGALDEWESALNDETKEEAVLSLIRRVNRLLLEYLPKE